MAVTETRVLPPEFIEAAGKVYLGDLATATGGYKTADLSKAFGQQFVAGQDPLQAQAQQLATQGIGAYQPFLNQAAAAQTTAGGLTGPQAYQQFMSPYQQDVISETLKEYDVQSQKGLPALAAQAINAGAFGGGREGVQRAEYQATSDRNRAALQAQLLQQGFGQAQNAAQQAFMNQQTLGNQQLNLAGQQQQFLGQDIGALSTFGAQNQALQQAQLGAQQQLAQQQLQQPLTAAQQYGQGVTSLIAGYPGQTTQVNQPSPNPLATAIGAGGTLAGIYRAFNQPGVFNR
jgi:hypothetical protein